MKTTPHPHRYTRLPRPAWMFLIVSALLTAASAWVALRHRDTVQMWPFGRVPDPFRDFYLYKPRYAFFHSPEFFTFQGWPYLYPAPPAVISWVFYQFKHSTTTFLLVMLAGIAAGAYVLRAQLVKRGIRPVTATLFCAATVLLSYPFTWDFQQANLEFFVWAAILCGFIALFGGHSYLCAVFFGLATAFKMHPVLLLAILVARKQYREVALGILVAVFTTIVSLWLVCPDLRASYAGIKSGIAKFNDLYVLSYISGFSNVHWDHSLFALVKVALSAASHGAWVRNPESVAADLKVYMGVSALLGTTLYFARIRHLPIVNQVFCLVIACVLLPPVSYDYTLIHLYIPWALLVLAAIEAAPANIPGLTSAMVSLAVLASPEWEMRLHGETLAGIIKTLSLLWLLVTALVYRFPSSFDRPVGTEAETYPTLNKLPILKEA